MPAGIVQAFAVLREPHDHLDRCVGIPLGRSLRPWRLHGPGSVLLQDVHGADIGRQRGPAGRHQRVEDHLTAVVGDQLLRLQRHGDQPAGAGMEQAVVDLRGKIPSPGHRRHKLRVRHAVEHRAVSLERRAQPDGPLQLQERGNRRVVSAGHQCRVSCLAQPVRVASILQGQPVCLGFDGGRFGRLGPDRVARPRGAYRAHARTAEPHGSHHDHDQHGAAARPSKTGCTEGPRRPDGAPGPGRPLRSRSCGSRHNVSLIVTSEDRGSRPRSNP